MDVFGCDFQEFEKKNVIKNSDAFSKKVFEFKFGMNHIIFVCITIIGIKIRGSYLKIYDALNLSKLECFWQDTSLILPQLI